MGYILLSPEHIKSKSEENKIENWHLFKAETLEKDNYDDIDELFLNDYDDDDTIEDTEENEYKRNCITIEDDNIKISRNPQCNDEIFNNITDLEKKDINSFTIGYRLKGIKGQYLNEFIKEYLEKHDNGNEEYDFQKQYITYYTNKNRTFFYSKNEDTIRMLACLLGRSVCGTCIATLYGDNKKEDENDLGF